jgi:hypothetical protein
LGRKIAEDGEINVGFVPPPHVVNTIFSAILKPELRQYENPHIVMSITHGALI